MPIALRSCLSFLDTIISRIVPHCCVLCGLSSQSEVDLCPYCCQILPQLQHPCECCGLTITHGKICGTCQQKPPPFHRLIAPWAYEFPISKLITSLKHRHQLHYTKVLSTFLWQTVMAAYQQDNWPEAVLPVPLHSKRIQQRGFNQAREIARFMPLPCLMTHCIRHKNTESQSKLSGAARKHNVKNIFQVTKSIPYAHIAIIDDVVTSSQTVRALSKTLLAAGVARVDVWCLARTQKS